MLKALSRWKPKEISLLLVMGFLMHIVRPARLQTMNHGNLCFSYCFEILCLWSSWSGPASTWCVSYADTTEEPSVYTAPDSLPSHLLKTEPPRAYFSWCAALCSLTAQITFLTSTHFIHFKKSQHWRW
jgi:hypothetical protein